MNPCPKCGKPLLACVSAQEAMQVRHWLCAGCGYESRAIGRERLMTAADPVQASIEMFVQMRVDRND